MTDNKQDEEEKRAAEDSGLNLSASQSESFLKRVEKDADEQETVTPKD